MKLADARMSVARLLRQPLLHFLLLGGLLFAGRALWSQSPWAGPLGTVTVSAAELGRLHADWQRETGRAPGDAEMRSSLQRHVDEQILLQEALRLGLDQRDAVVRQRLLQNMRFAFPDDAADDASLLQEARRMQMPARDLVARRRLVQLMEQRLTHDVRVGDRELQAYVAAHPERYAPPPRRAFRQLYFNPDLRGEEGAVQAARAALQQLQSGPAAAAGVTGDPFLPGERFAPLSRREIERLLGRELAQAVETAPVQAWSGPFRSGLGWHLLRVEPVRPAAMTEGGALRGQAAYALLAEREQQQLARRLEKLRQRYRVTIEAGGA